MRATNVKAAFGRLLVFGGHAQFILALLGALGLNTATATGVASVIRPDDFWDYALVVGVFLGASALSFPLSALLLNWALNYVELKRRRVLFDDPLEEARK